MKMLDKNTRGRMNFCRAVLNAVMAPNMTGFRIPPEENPPMLIISGIRIGSRICMVFVIISRVARQDS